MKDAHPFGSLSFCSWEREQCSGLAILRDTNDKRLQAILQTFLYIVDSFFAAFCHVGTKRLLFPSSIFFVSSSFFLTQQDNFGTVFGEIDRHSLPLSFLRIFFVELRTLLPEP